MWPLPFQPARACGNGNDLLARWQKRRLDRRSRPRRRFSHQPGEPITLTSDITHNPLSVNVDLFKGGAEFDPGSNTPPDGKTSFTMLLMPAGEISGTPLGDFVGTPTYRGTPDANGNMKMLDLIGGDWGVAPFPSMEESGSVATSSLTFTADGHYSLSFSLKEHGLWTGANGHWNRQIPSGNFGPPSSDGGNYTFSGRNLVSLYDNAGVSI